MSTPRRPTTFPGNETGVLPMVQWSSRQAPTYSFMMALNLGGGRLGGSCWCGAAQRFSSARWWCWCWWWCGCGMLVSTTDDGIDLGSNKTGSNWFQFELAHCATSAILLKSYVTTWINLSTLISYQARGYSKRLRAVLNAVVTVLFTVVVIVVVTLVVTEVVAGVVKGCNIVSDCLTIRRLGFEYICYSRKSKSPI